MAFNNVPANGWPQIKDLEKLDAIAQQIQNMPTFTSSDKAFLEELPAFPSEDGKKALVATTSSGDTSLNYEELSDLPADPETDGVRVLTATTSSGETVKSWETPQAGEVYSTTPVNTGSKWIDGKDIYRVVFTTGAVNAGAGVDITHGLSIDTLVSVRGVAVMTDRKLPLPYCDDTATYQRSIIVSDTKVTISGYTNSHALTGAHVIVEYTEATV